MRTKKKSTTISQEDLDRQLRELSSSWRKMTGRSITEVLGMKSDDTVGEFSLIIETDEIAN